MRPPIFLSLAQEGSSEPPYLRWLRGALLGPYQNHKGESHDSKSKDKRQGVYAFVGGIREGLTEE
jgi:hypothetical protein